MKLGMTVKDLRRRMDQAEFVRWQMYYSRIAQQQELDQLQRGG